MPYPSQHVVTFIDAALFDGLHLMNERDDAERSTEIVIATRKKGGKVEAAIQSIRLDASRFSPAAARAWLADHRHPADGLVEA